MTLNRALMPILREFKNRQVEWTPRQRLKVNLFEEELNPGIKFNNFNSINQYSLHLKNIYLIVKRNIILLLKNSESLSEKILLLEEFRILIHEIRLSFFPLNKNVILYSIHFKNKSYFNNMIDNSVKEKLFLFIENQKGLIDAIDELLKAKIKNLKYQIKIDHPTQTKNVETITNQLKFFENDCKKCYDLVWKGSDVNLLELVISLICSNLIEKSTGKMTFNEGIKVVEQLFNIELKSPYNKLNQAKNRKNDQYLMDTLKQNLLHYFNS